MDHQIRAQLSAVGCVIRGDLKYGASRSNKDGSIHLHAHSIAFQHPVKKEMMRFSALPPAEDTLWKLFTSGYPVCVDKTYVIAENKSGCVENFGINEIPHQGIK